MPVNDASPTDPIDAVLEVAVAEDGALLLDPAPDGAQCVAVTTAADALRASVEQGDAPQA